MRREEKKREEAINDIYSIIYVAYIYDLSRIERRDMSDKPGREETNTTNIGPEEMLETSKCESHRHHHQQAPPASSITHHHTHLVDICAWYVCVDV